jgi:hypothetical protein
VPKKSRKSPTRKAPSRRRENPYDSPQATTPMKIVWRDKDINAIPTFVEQMPGGRGFAVWRLQGEFETFEEADTSMNRMDPDHPGLKKKWWPFNEEARGGPISRCGYRVNYGNGQVSGTYDRISDARLSLSYARKHDDYAFLEFRDCDTGEWFQLRERR